MSIVKCIFLIVTAFLFSPITNSQTISIPLKDLSKEADFIITGKVVNQKSAWNSDKTRISTLVTLEVDEFIKGGNNQKTISVMHPGGEIDGVGELYTHIPRFENDEEVLLFLKQYGESSRVVAGESGKYTLYKDKDGTEKVTSQNQKLSSIKKEIKEALRQ